MYKVVMNADFNSNIPTRILKNEGKENLLIAKLDKLPTLSF